LCTPTTADDFVRFATIHHQWISVISLPICRILSTSDVIFSARSSLLTQSWRAARTGDKANINSRRNDTFLATGGIRGAGGGLSPSLPCISGVFG
ncbi:TPA: hypothetical protein ACHY1T_005388, partial [Escherichia coli]